MDPADQAKIIKNLVALISQTNLETLLPHLLQRGVFTNMMIEKYQISSINPSDRKRDLYLDLQRRGPDAFKHLVDSLHDTGHLDLVRLLEPGRNIDFQAPQNGNPEPSTSQQPPADWNRQNPRNVISLSTSSLTVNVKKATEWRDVSLPGEPLVYPMRSNPRGKVFLINNVEFKDPNRNKSRIGADHDERNFKSLFEGLGFIVESHQDLELDDMKNKIQEFACREEHKHYDCCVVAIMSHGHNLVNKLDSTIVASDGEDLQAEWVVEQFSNGKARHLVNRPKIFFFQTCRGDNYDFGVKLSRRTMEHDGYAEHIVPSMTDVLICHSTLPGFISHRDMYRGTWYIEAICDVFMENAHRMDLERMMKLVSEKLESLQSELGARQVPTCENRGFRTLYFNPGLFRNSSENGFGH